MKVGIVPLTNPARTTAQAGQAAPGAFRPRLARWALAAFLPGLALATLQAQTSYTDPGATGSWNTARWNNSADAAPYDANYASAQSVLFTAPSYSFAGMGAAINVGDLTLNDGVAVSFTASSSTLITGGNVRTLTVGAGSTLDFGSQALSSAGGTGFVKEGAGLFATLGGSYGGGFTLNSGTVIARGVNAMGNSAGNVLTLNGGTLASTASLNLSGRYGGGIVIGGEVKFGELSSNAALANNNAGLTFGNAVSLGAGTRTLTLGNHGVHTFAGAIEGAGGLVFDAAPGASGRFVLSGTNAYTGATLVTGGTLVVDGSLASSSGTTIGNGATLGGSGTLGATTFEAGSTVSPGNSIGTLNVGNTIWNGGSTYEFEFSGTDGSGGVAGTDWDLLNIDGTLDLSGASSANRITIQLVTMQNQNDSGLLAAWDPLKNAVWEGFVQTSDGILAFSPDQFLFDTSQFQNDLNAISRFSVVQDGNNLNLVYTAVPEPGTAGVLLGGLCALLMRRKRRVVG